MSGFVIFIIVLGLIALLLLWLAQVTAPQPVVELSWDQTPCKGKNANVCVAEGCFGQACRR